MKKEQKIDLLNRISSQKINKLNGVISFTVPILTENNLNELAAFAQMLYKVGINLELTRNTNAGIVEDYDCIVLKVNKEKYKTALTRHAGRKADFNKKYDKYGKCTVAELKEKLQYMTKTKIAEELGCSRMTLYRIIKNIEEQKPAEDISIWHYTS